MVRVTKREAIARGEREAEGEGDASERRRGEAQRCGVLSHSIGEMNARGSGSAGAQANYTQKQAEAKRELRRPDE